MDYNKLYSLKNKWNLSDQKMAEICGLKRAQSYVDMVSRKSMRVSYLERVCKHFNISIDEFFPDMVKTGSKSEKDLVKEANASYYKQCPTCAAKNETIELLKDRIKQQDKIMDSVLFRSKNTGE